MISNGMNVKNGSFLLFALIIISAVIIVGVYFLVLKSGENIVMQDIIKTFAVIKTNFGDIKLELFMLDAPNTVKNFIKLSKDGFYNGVRFHRVIKGFMIQAGDPLSKDKALEAMWGTGGPGYTFADEIHANNRNVLGTISMANAGPDTNGSQFFINTADNNFLDSKHTVFGKVVDGMDVVSAIENVKTDKLKGDRPLEDVMINSIEIIR
jgi:peptidylprolyl isomerase